MQENLVTAHLSACCILSVERAEQLQRLAVENNIRLAPTLLPETAHHVGDVYRLTLRPSALSHADAVGECSYRSVCLWREFESGTFKSEVKAGSELFRIHETTGRQYASVKGRRRSYTPLWKKNKQLAPRRGERVNRSARSVATAPMATIIVELLNPRRTGGAIGVRVPQIGIISGGASRCDAAVR
ncbi:hypothetical protein EVAR_67719_1 [Eumeta japonica]|uniref:Uncharacterized protein n=1 Tax=Eumeta variegata TaxID=151549 RepID=A0A4C1ZG65_EUMVA|nr:hypothetical protein EVAR_67719_1 [Eumeta japonica]